MRAPKNRYKSICKQRDLIDQFIDKYVKQLTSQSSTTIARTKKVSKNNNLVDSTLVCCERMNEGNIVVGAIVGLGVCMQFLDWVPESVIIIIGGNDSVVAAIEAIESRFNIYAYSRLV